MNLLVGRRMGRAENLTRRRFSSMRDALHAELDEDLAVSRRAGPGERGEAPDGQSDAADAPRPAKASAMAAAMSAAGSFGRPRPLSSCGARVAAGTAGTLVMVALVLLTLRGMAPSEVATPKAAAARPAASAVAPAKRSAAAGAASAQALPEAPPCPPPVAALSLCPPGATR